MWGRGGSDRGRHFQTPAVPPPHQKNPYPSRSSSRCFLLETLVTGSPNVDLTLFWIPQIVVLANVTELTTAGTVLSTLYPPMCTKPLDIRLTFLLSPFI